LKGIGSGEEVESGEMVVFGGMGNDCRLYAIRRAASMAQRVRNDPRDAMVEELSEKYW
jgi:hypothetical protein